MEKKFCDKCKATLSVPLNLKDGDTKLYGGMRVTSLGIDQTVLEISREFWWDICLPCADKLREFINY